jgi:hypothetical protein
MRIERRSEGNQVPDSLDEVLNEEQLFALNKMDGFGWILAFIRRPLFQNIVPVLSHSDTGKLGILEDDGALNLRHDIDFR